MESNEPSREPTPPAPVTVAIPASPRQDTFIWKAWICLSLFLLTVSIYYPAVYFDFTNFDDPVFVSENPHLAGGLTWEAVKWSFTAGLTRPDANADFWRPISFLSHAADIDVFGLNPGWHHLSNIAYHALASVVLFLALSLLTGTMWRSALVAALFAWHPLHVESVAWVAERKDVLSGLFWMLTLLCYGRYVQKIKSAGTEQSISPWASRDYQLALVCFVLGIMSKSMVVTLPLVLLLLDGWPLGRWQLDARSDWRGKLPGLVREKVPFLVVSALSCVITFIAQTQTSAVKSTGSYPLSGRIENMFVAYCRYLEKFCWPTKLAVLYPHPGHWPLLTTALAAMVLLAISVGAWLGRKHYPFLLIGWLWFLGTLIPVIGLVQVGYQSWADRYSYLPSIGIFIMMAWGAAALVRRWKVQPMTCAIIGGILLTGGAMQTRDQLKFWRNGGTLFEHCVAVTTNNERAYLSLGRYYVIHGELARAEVSYRAAIQINPNYRDAYGNLGTCLEGLGKPDEARQAYEAALRLDPNRAEIHFNLACLLANAGQREAAIGHLREALRLKPELTVAAQALEQLGATAQ